MFFHNKLAACMSEGLMPQYSVTYLAMRSAAAFAASIFIQFNPHANRMWLRTCAAFAA